PRGTPAGTDSSSSASAARLATPRSTGSSATTMWRNSGWRRETRGNISLQRPTKGALMDPKFHPAVAAVKAGDLERFRTLLREDPSLATAPSRREPAPLRFVGLVQKVD